MNREELRDKFETEYAKKLNVPVSTIVEARFGNVYFYAYGKLNLAWAECLFTHNEGEETIQRLRGQLQNCVNHLERCKRKIPSNEKKLNDCIEVANKTLYETSQS